MDANGTKVDKNGAPVVGEIAKEDAKDMTEPFNKEELIEIPQTAATRNMDVLTEVRKPPEFEDPGGKAIFVGNLGWDTTSDALKTIFSSFGELEEVTVMMHNKSRERSRGYGFVTFRDIEGAQRALNEPMINRKMSEWKRSPRFQLATRRIHITKVPMEMTKDRLLARFAQFGEIEQGPDGFDKFTGKFQSKRGFSQIVYKSLESAKRSVTDPIFSINGNQMYCQLAVGIQKEKTGGTSGQDVNEELGQLSGGLNLGVTPGLNQADEQCSLASQNQSPTIHSDWRNSEFRDRPFTEFVPGICQRMDGLALNRNLGPDMDLNGTKVDENGPPVVVKITKEDMKDMIEFFNKEELIEILQGAATRHMEVLEEMQKLADLKDPTASKKVFVRGLNWDTTSDTLKTVHSSFGGVKEGKFIRHQRREMRRPYGLVTFIHMDGAQRALKEPRKRIDGNVSECRLAPSMGPLTPRQRKRVAARKIYPSNVPKEMMNDRLSGMLAKFGGIEGPRGFDKFTGMLPRGLNFSEIVYASAESATRPLHESIFRTDGNQMYCGMYCQLAVDRLEQKTGGTSWQGVNEEVVQLSGGLNVGLTRGLNQAAEQNSLASQNQSPTSHIDWQNSEFWGRPFTEFIPGHIRRGMDGSALDQEVAPPVGPREVEELVQLSGGLGLTQGLNQAAEQDSLASQNQIPTSYFNVWQNSEFWGRPFTEFIPGYIRQGMDGLALNQEVGRSPSRSRCG